MIGKGLRLKQVDQRLVQKKAEVDREISMLRQEAVTSRGYLASLYENLVSGLLTAEDYRALKSNYEGKIEAAVERVRQLQSGQAELSKQVTDYISLADRLAEIDKNPHLSALLVEQLIERVTVNTPEDISIRFRFESGFERLSEVLEDE